MTADSDAFQVVQALAIPEEAQQYLLAVSRGEGFFGLGWGSPSAVTVSESRKFGIDPKAGVGSNNWGAEQGSGTAGSFPHVDFGWMVPDSERKPTQKHWTGKGPRVWGSYVGQYKKYNTRSEGALGVSRVLLKPNVLEALRTGLHNGQQVGRLRAAVMAQHDNHYFELGLEDYLKAVTRNYNALTSALKWRPLLTEVADNSSPPLAQTGQPSEPLPASLPSSGSFPLLPDDESECPSGKA